MDILLRRKKFRDILFEQKKKMGDLISITSVSYPYTVSNFNYYKRAHELLIVNHYLKKAKLNRTKEQTNSLGHMFGLHWNNTISEYRKALKLFNSDSDLSTPLSFEYKFNRYHRLFQTGILLDSMLASKRRTATIDLREAKEKPTLLTHMFLDKLADSRIWSYQEIQRKRNIQAMGTVMKKLREQAIREMALSSLKPSPNDPSKYVGIEIECASSLDTQDMIDHIASKKPSLHKYVRVGSDGSIRTEEKFPHAIEFRLMVSEEKRNQVILDFLEVTKGLIKVNSSCGLHVHLDMRSRNYGVCFEQLYVAMPILMSMVPESRRSNTYCKENKDKKAWNKSSTDRYQVLNPTSFRKYKTLEIRIHSATTSAKKIINWVDLLLCVIDRKFDNNTTLETTSKAKPNLKPERQIRSLIRFFEKFDVPAGLRNYVVRRISKFGKTENLIVPKELSPSAPSVSTNEEESLIEEESA